MLTHQLFSVVLYQSLTHASTHAPTHSCIHARTQARTQFILSSINQSNQSTINHSIHQLSKSFSGNCCCHCHCHCHYYFGFRSNHFILGHVKETELYRDIKKCPSVCARGFCFLANSSSLHSYCHIYLTILM